MRAEQKRIVASYGPATVAPLSQTIGARKRYRVLGEEVLFSLLGWKCTDKKDDERSPGCFYGAEYRGRAGGTDAGATTKKYLRRRSDQTTGRVGERTIALEITAWKVFGRYFKRTAPCRQGGPPQFRDLMSSKEEYWKGNPAGTIGATSPRPRAPSRSTSWEARRAIPAGSPRDRDQGKDHRVPSRHPQVGVGACPPTG
jgi:hypothetical protein